MGWELVWGLLYCFLPLVVYELVFLNGFVPKKLRACFAEARSSLMSIFMYVFIVYVHYAMSEAFTGDWVKWVIAIIAVGFGVMLIDFVRMGLRYSYMEHFRKRMGIRFGIFLVNLFVMLLFSVTMLNYVSYVLFPGFYVIPEGLNRAQLAVEFLYYTFMLLMTYNGATIVPVHAAAKVLQMLEIVVFFVYFGMIITDLFFKMNASKVAAEEKAILAEEE